jgi:hypothetical protein
MPLLNSGATAIAQALINDSFTPFSNANAHLAVGDGDAAFDETDTDLQGSSKTRKGMEATYPQRSGATLTFRSLFGTGDANHDWEEWGVANASSSGTLLNRKVESLGTKQNTQSWQLTVDVEIVNGDEV